MGHFSCGTCGESFPGGRAVRNRHCQTARHAHPRFECMRCAKTFVRQSALNQHRKDTDHGEVHVQTARETSPPASWYCADCTRSFDSANNLKMHLNSRIHRGNSIECPFCRKSYTTATGVAHHLESGGCPSARALNRDTVYKFVRSRDPGGLISKKLIGWSGSVEYEVDDNSWNGSAYECYLCHRQFRALHDLTQHVNSPIHQQPLYHCPNVACRQDFKNIPALFNHLESESCQFVRFEQVQRQVGDFFRSNRVIGF